MAVHSQIVVHPGLPEVLSAGSGAAALPVPRVAGAQPEASTARASGSLGRARGAPGSPLGTQSATPGRPDPTSVISHPGVRTSTRQEEPQSDGSVPQAPNHPQITIYLGSDIIIEHITISSAALRSRFCA